MIPQTTTCRTEGAGHRPSCLVFHSSTYSQSQLSDTNASFIILPDEIFLLGGGCPRSVARDRVHRCLCPSSVLRTKGPSSSFYGKCDCRDSYPTDCRYEAWDVGPPKESGSMARSGRSQQVLCGELYPKSLGYCRGHQRRNHARNVSLLLKYT